MPDNPLNNSYIFQPFQVIEHPNFGKAIEQLLEEISEFEQRKRSRTEKEEKDFRIHLKAIVSNLFLRWKSNKERYIAIDIRGTKYKDFIPRYHAFKWSSDHAERVRDALISPQLDYMEFHIGYYFPDPRHRKIPRIRAKQKLISLLDEKFGIKTRGSKYFQNPELIILRSPKDENNKKHDLDYEDTSETNRMRRNVNKINKTLQSHFIALFVTENQLNSIDETLASSENVNDEKFLDFSNNHLHRVFNDGSWEKGGRFYGGWWINLPSPYRALIEIDTLETGELDFAGFHPLMLYHKAGKLPPEGDMYDLDGYDPKKYRNQIKLAFLRLINTEKGGGYNYQNLTPLPKGKRPKDLFEDLKKKHQPILDLLVEGPAKTLMFLDSQMAEFVMLEFVKRDKIALPVHDSFIVVTKDKDLLKKTMEEAYEKVMGKKIRIDEKQNFFGRLGKKYYVEIEKEGAGVISENSIWHTNTILGDLRKSGVTSRQYAEELKNKPGLEGLTNQKIYSTYLEQKEEWLEKKGLTS